MEDEKEHVKKLQNPSKLNIMWYLPHNLWDYDKFNMGEKKKDISLPVSFSTTTSSIDSKYWLQSTGEKSRFLPGLQDRKKFHKKELFLKSSTEIGIQARSRWGEHAGVTQQLRLEANGAAVKFPYNHNIQNFTVSEGILP